MDFSGGKIVNDVDRSEPPLRWMVLEARAVGLRTARFELELSDHEQSSIRLVLRMRLRWFLLEILPFKRPTLRRNKKGFPVMTLMWV